LLTFLSTDIFEKLNHNARNDDQSNLIQKIQHRPAYVSMHNFHKMHWIERFYAEKPNIT